MNWVLFGACAICLPVFIIFKGNYKRLNIDLNRGADDGEDENRAESDSVEK